MEKKPKVKMKPRPRYGASIDRSGSDDILAVQRRYKRNNQIITLYLGEPRRFINDSGSVLCVACGKVRNTLNSAQRHYKQAHVNQSH